MGNGFLTYEAGGFFVGHTAFLKELKKQDQQSKENCQEREGIPAGKQP
jgi:hypothetical protein